ncbi:acyl-ACP--UDP-N-acetylglucosamine O-acyltransferase [Phenylobacterium aquaticum]|uniref:acyl-ACP--UDP-N-acetylglucosamine O-acyltransferase n=1 Tax=Phenylobacterium aquaticum TaxID=1763816 RepID=UPI0026EA09B4|nr:acyl-ACP--UDP-N-acetylglucosamine O-acyltransferase [Phenylobacterium aquaticum]
MPEPRVPAMDPSSDIHPTAVIEPGAVIGPGCRIGAYAYLGAEVVLAEANVVGPHVVIEGRSRIGRGNRFLQFASIGAGPQRDGWAGEVGRLEIGADNVFREQVTVNASTGEAPTRIGDRNLLMTGAHVGHDVQLGSDIRMANGATLGGHVQVEDFAWISGLCVVHQTCRIGTHAFVAGGAMVVQDVPPYCLVQGDRARLAGLNTTGLKRAGLGHPELAALRRAYRALFLRGGTLAERIAAARTGSPESPEVRRLADFLESAARGVISARRRHALAA